MGLMKEQWASHLPLPIYPPYGMTTEEFADCQATFTEFARQRIYSGEEYDKLTHQRMEELTGEQIVNELREEIADAVNYLAGLDIYLARIRWNALESN